MSTPKQRIARIPDIISTALEHGWKPEYEDDDGYFHYRKYRNADGAALSIDNDGTDSCFMSVTRKEDDNGRCYSFCRYELTLGETEEIAALPAEARSWLPVRRVTPRRTTPGPSRLGCDCDSGFGDEWSSTAGSASICTRGKRIERSTRTACSPRPGKTVPAANGGLPAPRPHPISPLQLVNFLDQTTSLRAGSRGR
jgi:hypothetical protein